MATIPEITATMSIDCKSIVPESDKNLNQFITHADTGNKN
jgi:hypothetical protein